MRSLAILLMPLFFANGEAFEFRVVDFGQMGHITQRPYIDIDGDGRVEILIFRNRTLTVFTADGEGNVDAAAGRYVTLAKEALYHAFGQVDEDPASLELVLVGPEGVAFHRYRDGAFDAESTMLFEAKSIVVRGQGDNLHWRGFLNDLDGDGLPDIVLATRAGYALHYQRRHPENGASPKGTPGLWNAKPDLVLPYRLHASVEVGPAGLSGRIRGSIGVPEFFVEDFTGDGRPDFAMNDGRSLTVFPGTEEGISPTPNAPINLSPMGEVDGRMHKLRIRDLNGDGLPDFVVAHRKEGIIDIFLGGSGLTEPAIRAKVNGWAFEPILADLDGDGRVDLIVPSTPEVGFATALSIAVTGTLAVKTYLFLNTGDPKKPFAKDPDAIREITVKIHLYVGETGQIKAARSVLVDYDGDFDGDGRKDLFYRTDTDELGFFPGQETRLFASSAAANVTIPDTEGYTALDSAVTEVNGDGRPDIILFYESRDRKSDRIVLLLSGKKGD